MSGGQNLFGTPLATSTDDAFMITAGGSYTADALSIGLQGLYDDFAVSNFGSGNHATYEGVSLNAAYSLGPGVSLEGQVAWTRSDSGIPAFPALNGINAYEVDVGAAITF